ncbi:LytR/AlgR family response regulator transcription factor [Sphingobacterium tabacisoli]|uniref:LytR/AlgR family response regulator transcription factor n=1 Tax=Sphingobacterium tabacisoli TaxID=2044855 RepID=A0ABW5L578_9SPHI|nr:LytTR family DNA-binding domain-containing protein [Sphingobacterium tabacisoli]
MKKLSYQVLLLDDKPETLHYILDMLHDLPFIAKPMVLSDLEEAFLYLKDNEVDILFLDMDFGRTDLDGVRFLGMINRPPLTIACSSTSGYVFDAHEVGIYKYIGKTISFKALERILKDAAEEADRKEERERRDIVKLELIDVSGREVMLQVADIYYAQVSNNVVTVYTAQEEFEFKISLREFDAQLPVDRFSRSHFSFLVALDRVEKIEGKKVHLTGAHSKSPLPISQEYNKGFRHALEQYRQRWS